MVIIIPIKNGTTLTILGAIFKKEKVFGPCGSTATIRVQTPTIELYSKRNTARGGLLLLNRDKVWM